MSRTLEQIYIANPITTNASTDLIYFSQSPYTPGHDAGMTYADFAAQFGAVYTPAALTRTNDTNVTLTLGGTPGSALLQAVTLTLGWSGSLTVARGGSGLSTLTAYTLLAGGTTATGNMQQVTAGTTGQLLQSNGAAALPSWTTAAFPAGSGTLNHMLRSDGTNWVQTTATTLDASDNFAGITSATIGNLNLATNSLISTNVNGDISIIPNGTGATLVGGVTQITAGGAGLFQVAGNSMQGTITVAAYLNSAHGPGFSMVKSRSTTIGAFSTVQNGDVLCNFNLYGDDGTSFGSAKAQILGKVSGAVSTGIVPTTWSFTTTNTSGTLLTALTLDNAQKATFGGDVSVGNLLLSANTLSSTSGNVTITPSAGNAIGIGAGAYTTGSIIPVQITTTTSNAFGTCAVGLWANDTNPAGISFIKSRATTVTNSANVTVNNGDVLSVLDTFAATAAAVLTRCARIIVTSSAVPSSGIAPTAMTFQTMNTAGSLVTGLTISNAQIVTLANALPVASGGTNATSASITAFNNITGYTAAGATGTTSTNLVFSTSPTLVTPILGAAAATSINFGGSTLSNYVSNTAFTPGIAFGGASVGVTYSTQLGIYTRIGSVVHFYISLVLTSKGSSTGIAAVINLPFTSQSSIAIACTFSGFFQNVTYAAGSAVAVNNPGNTTINMGAQITATTTTTWTDVNFANNSTITISGTYMV